MSTQKEGRLRDFDAVTREVGGGVNNSKKLQTYEYYRVSDPIMQRGFQIIFREFHYPAVASCNSGPQARATP